VATVRSHPRRPIIKNKLFYFADFQLTRQKNGVSNLETIPTALLEHTCVAGGTNCDFSSYAANIGNGVAGDPSNFLYDPSTGNSNGSDAWLFAVAVHRYSRGSPTSANYLNINKAACATPFQIPVTSMSAASLSMLAAFPTPTNGNSTTNFVGAGSGPYNQNSFDTRIDYAMRPTINVFGRFSLNYFALSESLA